jgi:hypothetical protein
MLSETPGADPHAGWCGRGQGEPGLYPIRCGGGRQPRRVGQAVRSLDASRRPFDPDGLARPVAYGTLVCFAPGGATGSGPRCVCPAGGLGAEVLTDWRSRWRWSAPVCVWAGRCWCRSSSRPITRVESSQSSSPQGVPSVRARLTEAPRRWSCCGQITTARFPWRSNRSGEVLDGSTRITATSTTTSMTDWWCTARRVQCTSAANGSFATASCSLNAASVRSGTEVQVRPSANAADHRASSIPLTRAAPRPRAAQERER